MGQPTPPATIANFKAQFSRDFKYGAGLDTVRDLDIQVALNAASSLYNPSLFDATPVGVAPLVSSEALGAYLYLAAHFLVTSVQAAGGLSKTGGRGINSQGEGVVGNKSAGGISVGYVWPASVTDNPALFQLVKTVYGQMYLQILMPRLVGNVGIALGNSESDLT